jgi:hypothetical protein
MPYLFGWGDAEQSHPGLLSWRCGENAILALLRDQRRNVVDLGGTSLCRRKCLINRYFT